MKNTLLSPAGVRMVLEMAEERDVCSSIMECLLQFQGMKEFASEIHTEVQLIKPILKILGYVYESKPMFFQEGVKNPDIALFADEKERLKVANLWGTREYYRNVLAIMQIRRYGRALDKGISGFYLEFENRIPLYQLMYMLKEAKTPWGILTNGKRWVLVKRPVGFDQRVFEIDIEASIEEDDLKTLRLFSKIFSLTGLTKTLPEVLEKERKGLIKLLQQKREDSRRLLCGTGETPELYKRAAHISLEVFPEARPFLTNGYPKEGHITSELIKDNSTALANPYNLPEIFSYIFGKREEEISSIIEEVAGHDKGDYWKEDLLSMKILDMTPNFGLVTNRLIEGIAYRSFELPYRERHSFVAEWEDEHQLKRYIMEQMLYGTARSRLAFDMFQGIMDSVYKIRPVNYRYGNPLLGISIDDISNFLDAKRHQGLFNIDIEGLLRDFRETSRLYYTLSDKIKEELKLKREIGVRFEGLKERIRDLLDLITASYLNMPLEAKEIVGIISMLDSDEPEWKTIMERQWFAKAKAMAHRQGFFHFEIEFPFLLNDAFHLIIAQPLFHYLWEEEPAPTEEIRAYIKKGMRYLRPAGKLILYVDVNRVDSLLMDELKRSKRYEVEAREGIIVLRKRQTG